MPKLYGMMHDEPRTIPLDLGDDKATITYRIALLPSGHYRDVLAGKWDKAERTTQEDEEYMRWLQVLLSSIIVSWDLQRDDGTPWPITDTEDGIQRVPPAFLILLWRTIRYDWLFPNPSGGGTTSAESKPQDTPEKSAT